MNSVSIKLVQRIREEFEEAPWLRFTVAEAAQFWGLEPEQCEAVMVSLVAQGFLAAGIDGRFAPQFSDAVDLAALEIPEPKRVTDRPLRSGSVLPWFGQRPDRSVRFHRPPARLSAPCCAR